MSIYATQSGLSDFERVVLPQGLVASGFFANVVMLSFDQALSQAFATEIGPGMWLADACRYVDDLRLVIVLEGSADGVGSVVKDAVGQWLGRLLEQSTPGLELSSNKTKIAEIGGDERPLVRQTAKMNRIQSAVSGGFDALGGEEILDAINGLMRAQDSLGAANGEGWRLSPVADVRDDTVARFGAARFRATYRSIRPLFEVESESKDSGLIEPTSDAAGRTRTTRTRRELDEDARAFALGLIQRWVQDPSNIRLLRIGLDIWPDVEVLREVLNLLRPFTEKGGRRKAPRRVAWYCLGEIFRAGATETGFVDDDECLPSGIDLYGYRCVLRDEAIRLVALPAATIPWYLRQQTLLFLAAFDPHSAPVVRTGRGKETRHYREMIRFLRGEDDGLKSADFAVLAILARRAFFSRQRAIELVRPALTTTQVRQIAERDLAFTLELINSDFKDPLFRDLPARIREDLSITIDGPGQKVETLSQHVLHKHPTSSLRNELGLLRFAVEFLHEWQKLDAQIQVITPNQIQLDLVDDGGISNITQLRIVPSRADPSGSLYQPPSWCTASDWWRFQLGFLLRFILTGQPDFTRPVRPAHWKEEETTYRPPESHRYQRLYGLYSAQSAFGDDWLPITDWVERLLLALLRWPGCRFPKDFDWVESGVDAAIRQIESRIAVLERLRGSATRALLLPVLAMRPTEVKLKRPLRACVVQTVIPSPSDFDLSDLALDDPNIRRRHRTHLSAALAAVERMLALRETHKGSDGRLDWLILPELAVHPRDVRTHLIPFARTHKTIILTGLTYQHVVPKDPLVNSALWIIPEWSDVYGLQMRTYRQGKAYLAPIEEALNTPSRVIHGFRPCQWLLGYPWTDREDAEPLWLTAAVCYDATDLGLAADLSGKSDVFAIPALNRDVKTFDQLALALHYHMFQLVIVANNGRYGGSNAYWPRSNEWERQVFHMHGQPQATIAFLEIDDVEDYLRRHTQASAGSDDWKPPPAGIGSN